MAHHPWQPLRLSKAILLALVGIPGGALTQTVSYIDSDDLVSASNVQGPYQKMIDVELASLPVSRLLRLEPSLASIGLINRRLILENRQGTLVSFAKECERLTKNQTNSSAVMLLELIVIYCERAVIHGSLMYSPLFYQRLWHSTRAAHRRQGMKYDDVALRFLKTERYGTDGQPFMELDPVDKPKRGLAPPVALNVARGISRVLVKKQRSRKNYPGTCRDLLKTASEWKAAEGAVAVISFTLEASLGNTQAAKSIANKWRTSDKIVLRYREAMVAYLKTGTLEPLRKAFDYAPVPCWKKGD